MENLNHLVSIAEASQRRERAAIQELKEIRVHVIEEKKKVEKIWKEKQKRLKERERISLEKEQALLKENERLKSLVAKSQRDSASMREKLAFVVKELITKDDEYQTRMLNLEEGVSSLISSTQKAISNGEIKNGADDEGLIIKCCNYCEERSMEIDNLRMELNKAEIDLHEKLEKDSNFILNFKEKRLKEQQEIDADFQSILENNNKQNEKFHFGDKLAISMIKKVNEENRRLRQEKTEAMKSSLETIKVLEENGKAQMESHVQACQVLRDLLESEKQAFDKYREKMNEKVSYLKDQLEKQNQLFNLTTEKLENRNKGLELRISNLETFLEQANDECERTREELCFFKEKHLDYSTVLNERQELLSQQAGLLERFLRERGKRDEKDLSAELEDDPNSNFILVEEINTLREQFAKHQQVIKGFQKDKEWLRTSRDAIAQGFVMQQNCVRNQLDVLNRLRKSFEESQKDHYVHLEESKDALDIITKSIVNDKN